MDVDVAHAEAYGSDPFFIELMRVAATSGKLENFLYLPVPQSLLADMLGLSVVHISRTLTKLKAEKLIRTTSDGVQILDRERLEQVSNFDSRYLHLEKLKF